VASETAAAGAAWDGDRGGHVWPKDREVVTDDGARIRYTVLGDDGPWMVVCSGYLCPDNFWAELIPPMLERHRVVVLNYRSVGASTDPRPAGWRAHRLHPEDYTIERLAGDVQAALEAEGATDAAVIGHSMGCQVALQLWRQAPHLVDTLSLVAGPYASPLHTFYGNKLGVYLFPFAYYGLPLLPRPAQRAIPRSLRLPVAMPVARLVRALGPHTPGSGMELYFRHFGEVDPLIALKIARGMHEFDAGPWLHEIDVPTLILVGERDTFSPPAIGEAMLAVMRDAELAVIREATHGAPIEFPLEIHDRVADFLHRRSGVPAAPTLGRPGVITPSRQDPFEARPA
jgi:pimeloyl-ACP methyl ester carboxylesterase